MTDHELILQALCYVRPAGRFNLHDGTCGTPQLARQLCHLLARDLDPSAVDADHVALALDLARAVIARHTRVAAPDPIDALEQRIAALEDEVKS